MKAFLNLEDRQLESRSHAHCEALIDLYNSRHIGQIIFYCVMPEHKST